MIKEYPVSHVVSNGAVPANADIMSQMTRVSQYEDAVARFIISI
jgi:hypothetical protein